MSKAIEKKMEAHRFSMLSLGGNIENWGIEEDGVEIILSDMSGSPPESMDDPVFVSISGDGDTTLRLGFKSLRAFFAACDLGEPT